MFSSENTQLIVNEYGGAGLFSLQPINDTFLWIQYDRSKDLMEIVSSDGCSQIIHINVNEEIYQNLRKASEIMVVGVGNDYLPVNDPMFVRYVEVL